MRFLPVIKWLRRDKLGARKGRASAQPEFRFRPQLQPLEDRCLLSTVAASFSPVGSTTSALFAEFGLAGVSSDTAGTTAAFSATVTFTTSAQGSHSSTTLSGDPLAPFLQKVLMDANAQGSSTVLVTVFFAQQPSAATAGTVNGPSSLLPTAYLLFQVLPEGEEQPPSGPVKSVVLPITANELAALASWWSQTVHPEPGASDMGGLSLQATPTGMLAAPTAIRISIQGSNASVEAVDVNAPNVLPAFQGLAAVDKATDADFITDIDVILDDKVVSAPQSAAPVVSSGEAPATECKSTFSGPKTAPASNSPSTDGEERQQSLAALRAIAHRVLEAEGAVVAAPSKKRDKTRALQIAVAWAAAQSLWHVYTTFSAKRPEPIVVKSSKTDRADERPA